MLIDVIIILQNLQKMRKCVIIILFVGPYMGSTEYLFGLTASRSSSLTNNFKLNDKKSSTFGAPALAFA